MISYKIFVIIKLSIKDYNEYIELIHPHFNDLPTGILYKSLLFTTCLRNNIFN